MTNQHQTITPADIRSKLSQIQGDATATVESARTQIITAVVVVGVVVVAAAFLLGRRGGTRRSTIIELKRA